MGKLTKTQANRLLSDMQSKAAKLFLDEKFGCLTTQDYVAIEKMLEYSSGIFGLPLRLLAREVYDKCVNKMVQTFALIDGRVTFYV